MALTRTVRLEARIQAGGVDLSNESEGRPAQPARHVRLDQIADSAADGIVVYDEECRIVYANPAAERIFGLSSDQLLGKRCDDPRWSLSCDGRVLRRDELACHQAITSGETVRLTERRFERADGTCLTVLLSSSPLRDDDGRVTGVINSLTDITALRQAQEERAQQDEYNRSLLRLYRSLGRARTYREIIAALMPEIQAQTGFRNINLSLMRKDSDEILVLADGGVVGEFFRGLMESDEKFRTRVGDDVATTFRITGDPHLEMLAAARDIYIDEDLMSGHNPRIIYPEQKAILEILQQHSICAVPIMLADEKLGLFTLSTHGEEGVRVPTPAQQDYLRALANHVAVAIDRVRFLAQRRRAEEALARTLDEVEAALDGVVGALASTTGERDPYTALHQERVARLACAIAEEMGLDEASIEGIRIAGVLHDIGKIAVPTEILAKPSTLSEMEFGIIRTHSEVGHRLLEGVPFHTPVAKVVLQHHETHEGSGYPDGLVADEILPEARILAVADVVEAMASYRPYRPALGVEAAIEEIERGAGTKYDVEAVRACVEVFKKKAFALT